MTVRTGPDRAIRVATPLTVAGVTALLLLWHLGTPALWVDESATAVARRRTWPHLWRLLQGPDAPLVPYYAVLKAVDQAAGSIVPALDRHQAVLLRWPSALAMVVAVTVLTSWVQRVGSTGVAVAAAALLLLSSGLSRYGQEARPYALVLMVAVLATVLWWGAVHGSSRRLWPAYALAVACLIALNTLAAMLVLVHLAAAGVLRADPAAGPGRWRRVRSTAAFAAAGVVLAAPPAVQAVRHGRGPTRHPLVDVASLVGAPRSDMLDLDRHATLLAVVLVLLCLAGLTRWNSARDGDLARLSALWAAVPVLLWGAAVGIRPDLLLGRYILFALPGFAVLAALGLLTALGWVARAVTGAERPRLTAAVATGLASVVLVAFALLQWPAVTGFRTRSGHGEDLRPVLAGLDRPAERGLPIYVWPHDDAIELQALDPADAPRLLNAVAQEDTTSIWPTASPPSRTIGQLRLAHAVIFLGRRHPCLPPPAIELGYRVFRVLPKGRAWAAYLAVRGAGTSGACLIRGRPSAGPGRRVR